MSAGATFKAQWERARLFGAGETRTGIELTLPMLERRCRSFTLRVNPHRFFYRGKGPRWMLEVFWDSPIESLRYEAETLEAVLEAAAVDCPSGDWSEPV